MDLADFIRMPRIPNVQLADGPGLTDLVRGELFLSSHHLIFHSEHKEIQVRRAAEQASERGSERASCVCCCSRCDCSCLALFVAFVSLCVRVREREG